MKTFILFVAVFVINFVGGLSYNSECEQGISAYLPDDLEDDDVPDEVKCKYTNEVFACGFSEAKCEGNFWVCGTGPCEWKCWCRPGFFRRADGKCVHSCPKLTFEDSTDVAAKTSSSTSATEEGVASSDVAARAQAAVVVETTTTKSSTTTTTAATRSKKT